MVRRRRRKLSFRARLSFRVDRRGNAGFRVFGIPGTRARNDGRARDDRRLHPRRRGEHSLLSLAAGGRFPIHDSEQPMRTLSVLPALLVASSVACSKDQPPPADTTKTTAASASAPTPALPPGESRLAVDGGRIWYRVVGSGNATPAILLHGGPGYSSFYMRSLEALGADRPVVRYDQLGAGKSDR